MAVLEAERTSYLQYQLIVSELKTLILDEEADSTVSKAISSNTNLVQELQQIHGRFVRLEAKSQLEAYNSQSSMPSASDKLLGLSSEDITVPKTPLQVNSVVSELVRRFSARLKNLESFVEFKEPKDATVLSAHQAFVDELAQKHQNCETREKYLEASNQAVDALYISYYNLLGKTLYLLAHMIQEDRVKHQAQQDQLNIKLLQSRAQAMIMKLSVLQHQIAVDTYNSETIPALKEIKSQLQNRTQNIETQLDRATKQLTQYENLGQGFVQLVRQYVAIMEATKDKQWTLSQLSGNE